MSDWLKNLKSEWTREKIEEYLSGIVPGHWRAARDGVEAVWREGAREVLWPIVRSARSQ